MKYILGIGGASGSIYGIRILEELRKGKHEVHVIVSSGAKKLIEDETSYTYAAVKKLASVVYENDNLCAGLASGSFLHDGMIIAPCSMKTLSSIANGYGETLISRAASCCLKEGRKLVLVIRETPLDLPGIRNMLLAKESGAVILPATPAFYYKPKKIDDVVNFIVGKVFDQYALSHSLFRRWG